MTPRRWWPAAPAVAAVLAVVVASARGLYVSPDAVFYVGTARNWLAGRGFTPPPGTPPLQHFPPLFPALLGAFGGDPLTVARVVNAGCLAGIVVLVGLVVRRRAASDGAGVVAAVLAAASADLLTYSASALSEPLFILLALGGLVALAAHLDRPRRSALVGAAALVAGALATRYVGLAVVAAGVAVLLWRRRWVDAGLFGLLSVAPLAVWLALVDGPNDRSVVLHLFGADYLGQAARPFARWILPWPGPPAGLVLALALVAAGVVLARRPAPAAAPLTVLLVAFAVAYLGLLLANRALTDATGRLDARFLAPLHVVAIVLVVPALARLPRPAVLVAGAVVVLQVAGALAWTAGGLRDDSVRRRGYTAADLRHSPALAAAGQPLYTNAVDAVWFLTGRTAGAIPPRKDYLTGRPNPGYAAEVAALHGYVLYFDAIGFRRSFQPSPAELEAALPLEVVSRDGVATLYRIR